MVKNMLTNRCILDDIRVVFLMTNLSESLNELIKGLVQLNYFSEYYSEYIMSFY